MVFLHSNSAHKPLYTPNYTWQIKCKTLLSCVFLLVQWAVKHTGVCHGTHTYMYVHKYIVYTVWLSLPLLNRTKSTQNTLELYNDTIGLLKLHLQQNLKLFETNLKRFDTICIVSLRLPW